jgi:hypothetical protein
VYFVYFVVIPFPPQKTSLQFFRFCFFCARSLGIRSRGIRKGFSGSSNFSVVKGMHRVKRKVVGHRAGRAATPGRELSSSFSLVPGQALRADSTGRLLRERAIIHENRAGTMGNHTSHNGIHP